MMPQSNTKAHPMFFLLGRGRSGTSLFQTILNAHKNIAVPPEAQFVTLLYKKYSKSSWSKKEVLSFYDDLCLEPRVDNWKLDKDYLKERLLNTLDEQGGTNYSKLCREVYSCYAVRKGKESFVVLGDKNPQYSLYVKQLIQVFPEAKFIHMIRDCRDNVLSFQKVDFDFDAQHYGAR